MTTITQATTPIGLIEGYAAIYGESDLNNDRITRGAFSKSLIPAATRSVKMLYQHSVERPIGRWISITEKPKGLFVRGEIFLNTFDGHNVWALIEGGAVDGLSIGFRARKARKGAQGRELLDVDLWEISIVTFPMAPNARISRWILADDTAPSTPLDQTAMRRDMARMRALLS